MTMLLITSMFSSLNNGQSHLKKEVMCTFCTILVCDSAFRNLPFVSLLEILYIMYMVVIWFLIKPTYSCTPFGVVDTWVIFIGWLVEPSFPEYFMHLWSRSWTQALRFYCCPIFKYLKWQLKVKTISGLNLTSTKS